MVATMDGLRERIATLEARLAKRKEEAEWLPVAFMRVAREMIEPALFADILAEAQADLARRKKDRAA